MPETDSVKNLIIPLEALTPGVIENQARQYGFAQPNTLEALIWDYELFAQLQHRSSDSFRLRGGAAVQLIVPLERQRASVDVDVLTDLPQGELESLLEEVSASYDTVEPYLRFEPYVPEEPAGVEGLHSYTTLAPSYLGQEWRLPDGASIQARMIKIDFLETARLPPGETRDGKAVGIALGYRPICVTKGYLLAEKLLTQARKTVGVPDRRYSDLPKHLYDIDSLLSTEKVEAAILEAAGWLPSLIEEQGKSWQGKDKIELVLEDLEASLLGMATIDYSSERARYEQAVRRLETLYLPTGSRMRVHRWATMAARALAVIRIIRLDNKKTEELKEHLIQSDRLAKEVMRHPDQAGLSRALYGLLPSSLRSIRQLKGSPPARLFWLLIARTDLTKLEELIVSS